jgi:adenosylhomocysteine nucleosidase
MIGIIGAMSVEVEALKEITENAVTEVVSGVEFVRGILCGKEVVIAKCGVGKVFAAICAEAMILKYSPDYIINTGVAGSLTRELCVLDVAISSGVIQHDMDTSPLGDPRGLLSGINKVELEASPKLGEIISKSADAMGIKNRTGIILSGDKFISESSEKKQLAEDFGGIACEMEGASIGHVCYVNGVEFAVIRAISDSLDGVGSMEFGEFVTAAAKQSQALVLKILKAI